jgi:hypothetical protein
MLSFITAFMPAASVNYAYSQQIEVQGGTAPYTYTVASGSVPAGMSLSSTGVLSGQATTIGVFSFSVQVVDSTAAQIVKTIQMSVINVVNLSEVTVDQGQFVQQLQETLTAKSAWTSGLTTQTSQTLIELVSAVGTYETSKIIRAREDAYPETAQSDSAIRAIATMQGLRLSRKLPAQVQVTLTSPTNISFGGFVQFSGGGYNWFTRELTTLVANVPKVVTLREGTVHRVVPTGRGTDLQAWVSPEDGFQVSDQDVAVSIDGSSLNKAYGGLWNYAGLKAYSDSTLSDGRLMIQFGSQSYGGVPGVNDLIQIDYATTSGSSANGAQITGAKVTGPFVDITGTFTTNPSGGADEKPPLVYKNFASGTFGTYSSGVTKAQYHSLVNNYPGLIDAITQSQREINPSSVAWMNIIRVSGITTGGTWTPTQIKTFTDYMESITMFTSKFLWQEPQPIARDVNIEIYCFNSVSSLATVTAAVKAAVTKLFSARPGILMTNLYVSDLIEAAMDAAPGQISYVQVNAPTSPMIVTAPVSPTPTFTVTPSGGTLLSQVYSYAISVNTPSPTGVGTDIGNPVNWVFPQVTVDNSRVTLNWADSMVPDALNYIVWGRRAGLIGKIATLVPIASSYIDNGSITPTPEPIGSAPTFIRYNTLNSLVVNAFYAGRQTKATFPVRDTI